VGLVRSTGRRSKIRKFYRLPSSEVLPFYGNAEGYEMDLRFLRDTDKRETDFVVLKEGKPVFAVECKSGENNINPSLFYFMERTQIPKFYQVHAGKKDYEKNSVRVLPVQKFIKELSLP
jgi:uncharacterized protein